MTPATFRLILLISCAHALVHVFELSLPSVEQMIGREFAVGKAQTGLLGTVWRVPFGVGAVFTGWLVDRYGSKRLLLIYLAGCVVASLGAAVARTLDGVTAAMLAMGCFASIYHPAGLALISRETTPENRGAALGWHGIFGSVGIAAAPLLAGVIFSGGTVTWRQYYVLLCLPAVALAVWLTWRLRDDRPNAQTVAEALSRPPDPLQGALHGTDDPDRLEVRPEASHRRVAEVGDWKRYSVLVTAGVLSGFIYGAFMHFLPRYLDESGLATSGVSPESLRNRLAALVLICGVAGQSLAGRLARPGRLEGLLALILLANAPLLVWMALASGPWRVAATCTLALVHFMNQPVYNSLIAQYVSVKRRSIGYGFSNMVCFSIGGLGPTYAGFTQTDARTYGGLAIVALAAGLVSLVLVWRRRSNTSAA